MESRAASEWKPMKWWRGRPSHLTGNRIAPRCPATKEYTVCSDLWDCQRCPRFVPETFRIHPAHCSSYYLRYLRWERLHFRNLQEPTEFRAQSTSRLRISAERRMEWCQSGSDHSLWDQRQRQVLGEGIGWRKRRAPVSSISWSNRIFEHWS